MEAIGILLFIMVAAMIFGQPLLKLLSLLLPYLIAAVFIALIIGYIANQIKKKMKDSECWKKIE